MRIVKRGEVKHVLNSEAMLLLSKARFGLSLIDISVHQHPSFVSTIKEKTTLPLEIWNHIITYALEGPLRCVLVRPRALQREEPVDRDQKEHTEKRGYTSSQALICDQYKQRVRGGSIREEQYPGYRAFLDGHPIDTQYGVPPPKPRNKSFAIDLDLIDNQQVSRVQILFWRLKLPDVIAWYERGQCGFCDSRRHIHIDYLRQCQYDPWRYHGSSEDERVPCPLCIGIGFTNRALSLLGHIGKPRGNKQQQHEFNTLLAERFQALGYLAHTTREV